MIHHLRLPIAVAFLLALAVHLRAQDDNAFAKAAAAKATERRGDIQKKLASGSEVLKHFRADSFTADGPRLKVAGVFLEFGFTPTNDPDAKPPFECLQDELREIVRDVVKEVARGKQVLFDFSGIVRVERDDRLFPRLQKAIAARPALDGVRIEAKAAFGRGGELLPGGIRPKLADAKEREALDQDFGECYREVLAELATGKDASADRYKKFAVGPAAKTTVMREADTRKILAHLRDWAKSAKDDIRFARLYFGPDGGLKLLCEAPSDQDIADVRGKLKEFAPEYYPARPRDGAPPAPAVDGSTIPAFTPFLQKQLAEDPKHWSAVLIERGYFDVRGRFMLRGIIDRKEQKAALAELVAEFERDPKWKAYFARAVDFQLDVMPMDELVARVQRVAPAYPAFDGIAITKASYDEDANLVFTAKVIGKAKLNDARLLLAGLLAKHPDYSRRVARSTDAREPKVRIEALMVEPSSADANRAAESAESAAAALAKEDTTKAQEWIDLGILHYPNDSTIWFLSAYYHYLKGDTELVRRDLFRMIAIEGDRDSFLRKRRFAAAKDLQGPKRDVMEKIEQQSWDEAKKGVKPITLVPAK
jgi:hypothetical protein